MIIGEKVLVLGNSIKNNIEVILIINAGFNSIIYTSDFLSAGAFQDNSSGERERLSFLIQLNVIDMIIKKHFPV